VATAVRAARVRDTTIVCAGSAGVQGASQITALQRRLRQLPFSAVGADMTEKWR
jgi:hypothetical protein